MYITYDEYLTYGGELDEATFTRYEFEAECLVDWYTFNRLQDDESYSDEIKTCMYMLINLIEEKYKTLSVNTPNDPTSPIQQQIASQSNDGVSVSYVTMSTYNLLNFCKQEIENTINFCLRGAVNKLGRKLLYRGLYPGE